MPSTTKKTPQPPAKKPRQIEPKTLAPRRVVNPARVILTSKTVAPRPVKAATKTAKTAVKPAVKAASKVLKASKAAPVSRGKAQKPAKPPTLASAKPKTAEKTKVAADKAALPKLQRAKPKVAQSAKTKMSTRTAAPTLVKDKASMKRQAAVIAPAKPKAAIVKPKAKPTPKTRMTKAVPKVSATLPASKIVKKTKTKAKITKKSASQARKLPVVIEKKRPSLSKRDPLPATRNKATQAAPAKKTSTVEKTAPVKATRKRVPVDFALQYGESIEQKPRKKVEETKRRPRRDAMVRQKMRDVMEPGDELVARLRRAGVISGVGPEDDDRPTRRMVKQTTRRPRRWEARCGKCGNKSVFLTPAGLCARCGAIMVREV